MKIGAGGAIIFHWNHRRDRKHNFKMRKAIIFIATCFHAADAIKCFVCTGERDHIGFKDAKNQDCWENPEASEDFKARECKIGEDRCVTSVMVDFRFDGMLVSTMTRKCADWSSVGSLKCKETDDKDEIGFEVLVHFLILYSIPTSGKIANQSVMKMDVITPH